MKCPNCGSDNKDEARFCFRCGKPLPEKVAVIQNDEHEKDWVANAFGGKYQIISELGRGGMAIVYEAFDIALDRKVAVKVLPKQFAFDEEFVKRFLKAAKIAAKLEHPNIVKIFDIGQQGEIHYFIMNFLSGDTLKDRIRQASYLSMEEITIIAKQICDALSYAHNKGIIHRDLKPSNIMFDSHGNVVLMDFGIAYAAFGTKITSTGTQMGTPHYMSPEQASGEKVDHRADIYSLGIILYEMATGEVPFQADSSLAVLHKQIYEKPVNPKDKVPEIPNWFVDVVMTCLEKDKEARYQSAREVLLDIEAGMNKHGISIDGRNDLKEPIKQSTTKTDAPMPKKDTPISEPIPKDEGLKQPTGKSSSRIREEKREIDKITDNDIEAKPDLSMQDSKLNYKEPRENKDIQKGSRLTKVLIGLFALFSLPIIIIVIYAFATGILYFE